MRDTRAYPLFLGFRSVFESLMKKLSLVVMLNILLCYMLAVTIHRNYDVASVVVKSKKSEVFSVKVTRQ